MHPVWGEKESAAIARALMEDLLGCPFTAIVTDAKVAATPAQITRLYDSVKRLLHHQPLQYVLGKSHFFGHTFFVNPSVLIPRPETEALVQLIIDDAPPDNARILDIGTGSGCIAISLALALPHVQVAALDYSEAALATARQNALALAADVTFFHGDILAQQSLQAPVDILVSNPPYVRRHEQRLMARHVLDHEPHSALFVPDDDPLIFYKKIAELDSAPGSVTSKVYLEINEAYGAEVCALFGPPWAAEVIKDMHGKDRMVRAVR